jgi:hypothetical protein
MQQDEAANAHLMMCECGCDVVFCVLCCFEESAQIHKGE